MEGFIYDYDFWARQSPVRATVKFDLRFLTTKSRGPLGVGIFINTKMLRAATMHIMTEKCFDPTVDEKK